MTPEIFHRCESCGATIRQAAMFCPECGKPLAITKQEGPDLDNQASAPPSTDVAASAPEQSTPSSGIENQVANAEQVIAIDAATADSEPAKAAISERHGARERTRDTLHRASTAARGAIERPVKQVEKIHHVSTVMLEEAHYDPSLRFVLVALGLFLLFVILLVLSKVMG
jgi:hypothetical protein